MTNRFSQPADPYAIPPEHVEAYQEMCGQFARAVIATYRDALRTTIMRELPSSLQLNALLTGAIEGGLIPLLMTFHPQHDREIAEALQASFPTIIAHARKTADEIEG